MPVQALLGRIPGGDYPHVTAAALLLSIQATEASDPKGLTRWLLQVLAALSPDGVRRDLLDGLRAPRRRRWRGGGGVDAAVKRCVAGSLLTWSGGQGLAHNRAAVANPQEQAGLHIEERAPVPFPLLAGEANAAVPRRLQRHVRAGAGDGLVRASPRFSR